MKFARARDLCNVTRRYKGRRNKFPLCLFYLLCFHRLANNKTNDNIITHDDDRFYWLISFCLPKLLVVERRRIRSRITYSRWLATTPELYFLASCRKFQQRQALHWPLVERPLSLIIQLLSISASVFGCGELRRNEYHKQAQARGNCGPVGPVLCSG